MPETVTTLEVVTKLPPLPSRSDDAHKGDCGRALVIAGSRGMSGAACLAAAASLRAGAGLVTAAIPQGIQEIVAGYEPSYLTAGLPDDDLGRLKPAALKQLLELVETQNAAAIGPGLDRADAAVRIDRGRGELAAAPSLRTGHRRPAVAAVSRRSLAATVA